MGFQPSSANQDQASAAGSQGAALCLVFADARGRIVFADSNFLDLVNQDEAKSLIGEPLYRILRCSQQSINELISSIAQMGYVRDHMLEIRTLDENPVNVACTGVGTYDDQGAFIGADLTLCDITHYEPTKGRPGDRDDTLSLHIKEGQGDTHNQLIGEKQGFALGYFTAQVMALQVLLGRMGGPRVREMVEALVNQAAEQHNWAVQLQGGHLDIGSKSLPLDAYATLLKKIVDYGENIIGRQVVKHEMHTVDVQMTEHLREIADQAGLRKWAQG
jgi:hypothetical protein